MKLGALFVDEAVGICALHTDVDGSGDYHSGGDAKVDDDYPPGDWRSLWWGVAGRRHRGQAQVSAPTLGAVRGER